MTESAGEVIAIRKMNTYEDIALCILLIPEDSTDPSQIWEWKIGEKVKVIGDE